MEQTITAKIRIYPTDDQAKILERTMEAYQYACCYVSSYIFDSHDTAYYSLHDELYQQIRYGFRLGAQTAQSAIKTTIAAYKSIKSNGHKWTEVEFRKPCLDLVRGRDYSFAKGCVSIWSVEGRQKVAYTDKGMGKYFDSSVYKFGTAKLVRKGDLWFMHIPVTFDAPECDESNPADVVGVDVGVNFVAVYCDDAGKTVFVPGKTLKNKRTNYKKNRRDLQKRKTPSSRRRLKKIGQRENRWMQDVNHCVSKTLVTSYPSGTLFVAEDLTGIRSATEKVRLKDRYVMVSWSFYDLQQKIAYKARMNGSSMIRVNPAYTSQKCPKCGHTERSNRNRKKHSFCCKNCGYRSNDDRIGAMNLHAMGKDYVKSLKGV